MIQARLVKDISKKNGNEYYYIELVKECKTNEEFTFNKRVFLDDADIKLLRMIDLLDNNVVE